MNNRQELFFEPWVGDDYRTWPLRAADNLTVPIHFLGESHYGTSDEYLPSFTRDVVRGRGKETSQGPFFSNVMKAWAGVALAEIDRSAFWNGVAFSNYVQEFLPGPRLPPTGDMWKRGDLAFEQLLQEYQPDAMLVLGQRLWNAMTKEGSSRLKAVDDSGSGHANVVRVDDARLYQRGPANARRWTIALHILHPSAPAFDLEIARRRIALFRQEYMNNIDTRGQFEPITDERRAAWSIIE